MNSVIAHYLGLVADRRPPMGALTQLFCDDVPVESGKTKILFDREAMDEGLAPLVHWRLDGVPLTDEDLETVELTPAYSQIDRPIDPEKLTERLPGEPLDAPYSAVDRREMWIVMEMLRRENRRVRLVEWMVAQVLVGGSVVLTSPHYTQKTLNFGRDPSLTGALVGTSRWGQDGIRATDNLEDWGEEVLDLTGSSGDTVIMGSGAWKLFKSGGDVKEILDSRRGSASTGELGPSNKRGLAYKGTFGDKEVWVAADSYLDAEKVRRKFFPTNGVWIGDPEDVMMKVAYGAIIHSETMNEPIPGQMFHHVYSSKDGKFENLYSATAPLAFPMRPNAGKFVEVG